MQPPTMQMGAIWTGFDIWRRMIGAHDTPEPRRETIAFCQSLNIELMRWKYNRKVRMYHYDILLMSRGPDVS